MSAPPSPPTPVVFCKQPPLTHWWVAWRARSSRLLILGLPAMNDKPYTRTSSLAFTDHQKSCSVCPTLPRLICGRWVVSWWNCFWVFHCFPVRRNITKSHELRKCWDCRPRGCSKSASSRESFSKKYTMNLGGERTD